MCTWTSISIVVKNADTAKRPHGGSLAVIREEAYPYMPPMPFPEIWKCCLLRLRVSTSAAVWSTETEGRDLAVDQVEVTEADAPEHVRALLGLEQGAGAVLRSRRYVLDGKPVCCPAPGFPPPSPQARPSRDPTPGPAASTPASPTSATPPRGSARTSAPGCHCPPRRTASRSPPAPRSSKSAGSRSTPPAPPSKSTR